MEDQGSMKEMFDVGLNEASMDRLVLILEIDIFAGRLPPFPDVLTNAVVCAIPLHDFPEHLVQKFTELLHRALIRRIGSARCLDAPRVGNVVLN